MVETIREYLHRLGSDIIRVVILLVLMYLVASVDGWFKFSEQYAYLTAILTSTSIVLAVGAISHIVRRILFPDVDLREYAWKALDNPVASSIVFLGICIVLSVFVVVNIQLLD